MNICLEQIFYGRGPQGYAVLGLSQGGEAFGDTVRSLCESIGSPYAASSFQPFLVSKPYRDQVIMVRVRCGEPDSIGRATVFFHALVGSARELAAAQVNAFVLKEHGLFADRVPAQVERLSFSPKEATIQLPAPRFRVAYPAAIVSMGPEKELVLTILGTAALGRAWSTYAFHPMSGFDLYVLDGHALRPTDAACYDRDGRLLSEPAPGRTEQSAGKTDSRKRSGGQMSLLKLSLALNLILIIACLIIFASSGKPAGLGDSNVGQSVGLKAEK